MPFSSRTCRAATRSSCAWTHRPSAKGSSTEKNHRSTPENIGPWVLVMVINYNNNINVRQFYVYICNICIYIYTMCICIIYSYIACVYIYICECSTWSFCCRVCLKWSAYHRSYQHSKQEKEETLIHSGKTRVQGLQIRHLLYLGI